MSSPLKIAIDGYSSCGKSTLAKDLAKELGYIFIDSGAMYRAVTLFALEHNLIDNNKVVNKNELIHQLHNIHIDLKSVNGKLTTYLNDKRVEELIRDKQVSEHVSLISAIPEVRSKLVEQQRLIGSKGGIVMDGRDIGTVVFPQAELKLFVTASIEIRTQRRFNELEQKGIKMSKDEVRQNLIERDHLDSTRATSPLQKAHDAIEIDNSELDRQEQLQKALELVHKTRKKIASV